MILRNYISIALIALCVLSASLGAMEEQDPFNWDPERETPEYHRAMAQEQTEKNVGEKESEEEPLVTGDGQGVGSGNNAAHDNDAQQQMDEVDRRMAGLEAELHALIQKDKENKRKKAVAEQQNREVDPSDPDPLHVGWVNMMRTDKRVIPNAPFEERDLPVDLQAMVSEYQKEWHIIRIMAGDPKKDEIKGHRPFIAHTMYDKLPAFLIPCRMDKVNAKKMGAVGTFFAAAGAWYYQVIQYDPKKLAVRYASILPLQWSGDMRSDMRAFIALPHVMMWVDQGGRVLIAMSGAPLAAIYKNRKFINAPLAITPAATTLTTLYGNLVAIGCANGTIEIWDMTKLPGEQIAVLQGEPNELFTYLAYVDGHRLRSCSTDSNSPFKIWDLRTGAWTSASNEDAAQWNTVAMPPMKNIHATLSLSDGRVITTSGGRTVMLWECKDQYSGAIRAYYEDKAHQEEAEKKKAQSRSVRWKKKIKEKEAAFSSWFDRKKQ